MKKHEICGINSAGLDNALEWAVKCFLNFVIPSNVRGLIGLVSRPSQKCAVCDKRKFSYVQKF